MKRFNTDIIKNIIILVIVLALGIAIYGLHVKHYNHGICPNCGIPYQENGYIQDGNSYTKYKCPECGHHGIILDVFKD